MFFRKHGRMMEIPNTAMLLNNCSIKDVDYPWRGQEMAACVVMAVMYDTSVGWERAVNLTFKQNLWNAQTHSSLLVTFPSDSSITADVKSKHPVKIKIIINKKKIYIYIYIWERLFAWESNMQHMQFHYHILHHSWWHCPSWTWKNSHTGSM